MIKKRFPADTAKKELTFLRDKKVDAELYAYFQSISIAVDGETIVNKIDLGTQAEICQKMCECGKKMGVKTYRAHLKYLIEQKYIIEEDEYYILPKKEDIYLMIPLETIIFIQDVLKEPVIKTYIYLGQRYKYKRDYLFTEQEIADCLGISLIGNGAAYKSIKNYLYALKRIGLIDFEQVYIKKKPQLKLIRWNLTLDK